MTPKSPVIIVGFSVLSLQSLSDYFIANNSASNRRVERVYFAKLRYSNRLIAQFCRQSFDAVSFVAYDNGYIAVKPCLIERFSVHIGAYHVDELVF